jgi:hypothetical protein
MNSAIFVLPAISLVVRQMPRDVGRKSLSFVWSFLGCGASAGSPLDLHAVVDYMRQMEQHRKNLGPAFPFRSLLLSRDDPGFVEEIQRMSDRGV